MLPGLEHLIHLQRLETASDQRRRWIAELPERLSAIEARVATAKAEREAAAARLSENQAARRALDKDLGEVQGRLTKFKDQLMEVKTNREYTTMQHEIAMAQERVSSLEDQILTLMMEGDELSSALRAAEEALAAEERKAAEERAALEAERARVERELEELRTERSAVEAQMSPDLVRLFADVATKRRGLAVVEVRDGHCSACQVRLRPQLVLEIRRGDHIAQCESCSRILYIAPAQTAAPPSGG
ncbi:MAG TPA: C4-type zinc ribbon domain-containing protein [Vicinamibacterales bacterium]